MTFGKLWHLFKIEECYSYKFFTLAVAVRWMKQIAEFISTLHQMGFHLGIPIERCLFINTLKFLQTLPVLEKRMIFEEALKKCL